VVTFGGNINDKMASAPQRNNFNALTDEKLFSAIVAPRDEHKARHDGGSGQVAAFPLSQPKS
jgi:hypothetical protein